MSAPLKTIDGREFAFGRIPPTKSVPLQVQLVRLVGPEIQLVLGQDINRLKADVDAKNWDALMGKLAPMLLGILQSADGAEVLKMMETVFAYVNVDGHAIEPNVIDATFRASPSATIWKVFFEGLKVNYADFFPASPSDSPEVTKP